MKKLVKVIIPAFNEQNAVGNVVREIPRDLVDEVVVVNNASTDETEIVAKEMQMLDSKGGNTEFTSSKPEQTSTTTNQNDFDDDIPF